MFFTFVRVYARAREIGVILMPKPGSTSKPEILPVGISAPLILTTSMIFWSFDPDFSTRILK